MGVIMKWIPLAMVTTAFATSSSLIADGESKDALQELSFEFALDFNHPENEPKWSSVNDGVMGGLSEGQATIENGVLIFEGALSLENNGGFASVRTPTVTNQYNFAGSDGLVLRVKGDGRSYQLRLSTDARHRGSLVSYQSQFETENEEWMEVRVPFQKMKPSWRGQMLSGHVLDASKVSQLGILIGDKKEGPFRLEVDWLKVF